MADEMRIALTTLLRKAGLEADMDLLRQGVQVNRAGFDGGSV